jgi:xanthine dehydrogenase/oxidase
MGIPVDLRRRHAAGRSTLVCESAQTVICHSIAGYLEGVYIIENCIEHVAHALGLPVDQVRERNFYKKGDVTPFGQTLNYCNAQLVYNMVRESSDYDKRLAAVKAFNAGNR